MANARIAQLLEQRRASKNLYSGDRIRLLSPSNNAVASIAKQAASSELDVMTSKYNNGEISNEEMRNFLTKLSTNIGLSAADKLQVSNQIADFDSRITLERLNANYKAAPDGTMAQLQAAQAIASFYSQKASTQQPGTPAQSQSLQDAASWNSQITNIKEGIQKNARTNQRYISEQKINQLPSGTSENATAKAKMWSDLYNQAIADGDTTAANQYAANYQKELTNADTYSAKETAASNKKTVSDYINTTLNDYHRGKISGDEAIQQLQQADEFAASTGDTSTQLRLENLYITISREVDKGVTYSSDGTFGSKATGSGGSGEPVLNPDGSISYSYTGTTSSKSGSTKAGGGAVTGSGSFAGNPVAGTGLDKPKTFAELDFEYKNDLSEASKALLAEKTADGKPFTPADYQFVLEGLAKTRQIQLQTITDWATNIVKENGASSKVGKAALAVVDKYSNELKSVTAEYNGIVSGNLVLAMDVSKGVPTINFVAKSSVGDAVNVNGIYQQPRTAEVPIDKNTYNKLLSDPSVKVGINPVTGQYYVEKMQLDVYDTAGNKITYENDPKYGWLPQAVGPKTGALRNQMIKEFDIAAKSGSIYTPKLMTYNEVNNFNYQTPAGTIVNHPVQPENPNLVTKAQDVIGGVAKGVSETVNKVVAPSMPIKPVEQLNLPQNIPLGTQGQQAVKTAFNPTAPQPNPAAPSAPLKVATQAPSPVAKAAPALQAVAKQNNIKPVSLGTPIPKAPAPQQSLSPVDFFKKLLGIK